MPPEARADNWQIPGTRRSSRRRRARGAAARARRGFGLGELLVVLGVIALLAGLLSPILVRCRQAAQQQVCASHLRQIGLALRMYGDDNDGGFPIGAYLQGWSPVRATRYGWNFSWHNALAPYSGGYPVLFCPLVPRGSGYRISYGCNAWISRWQSALAASQIEAPARTVYAAEKQDEDWPAFPPSTQRLPHHRPLVPRHNGFLLELFCDGHAHSLPGNHAEGEMAVWRPWDGVRPPFLAGPPRRVLAHGPQRAAGSGCSHAGGQ